MAPALFADGVQLLHKVLEPYQGGILLFTTKFQEVPGTYFSNLRRMKGWVGFGATHWF